MHTNHVNVRRTAYVRHAVRTPIFIGRRVPWIVSKLQKNINRYLTCVKFIQMLLLTFLIGAGGGGPRLRLSLAICFFSSLWMVEKFFGAGASVFTGLGAIFALPLLFPPTTIQIIKHLITSTSHTETIITKALLKNCMELMNNHAVWYLMSCILICTN